MAIRFVNIDRKTPLLLPPDMRDWVPAKHLVHFVIDAIDLLDMRSCPVNQRGTGDEQYPSSLLLSLLVYSYACGVFSSRQIERSTYENLAVRVLCADTHPDHDTLCTFRRNNLKLLQSAFAQVLELAAHCKVLKVGNVTVAIDGTKILASASKHSSVSYGHAGKTMQLLGDEVAELLRKAETADAVPLQDGLSIPEEVQRRKERIAILAKARAEMESRTFIRCQVEQKAYDEKMAAREAQRAEGKKPRGKEPTPPDATPGPTDQVNFTDEESRIMKTSDGFQQCYNAQAGADTESRLIVGERVTNAPNDKQQLVADVQEIKNHVQPGPVLIDSGFVSQAAIKAVETEANGQHSGVTVYAAMQRENHGRTVAQLEKREDPTAPAPNAPFAEKMLHRTATAAGRALYKLRQQTIEPIFGIIKSVMGFRRFMLRGLAKVGLEWKLVCLAYNLRRLHMLNANLRMA